MIERVDLEANTREVRIDPRLGRCVRPVVHRVDEREKLLHPPLDLAQDLGGELLLLILRAELLRDVVPYLNQLPQGHH